MDIHNSIFLGIFKHAVIIICCLVFELKNEVSVVRSGLSVVRQDLSSVEARASKAEDTAGSAVKIRLVRVFKKSFFFYKF